MYILTTYSINKLKTYRHIYIINTLLLHVYILTTYSIDVHTNDIDIYISKHTPYLHVHILYIHSIYTYSLHTLYT